MYKIVIVDDNYATADMIAGSVNWAGIGCAVAGVAYDGVNGRRLLMDIKPDIIIADIRMPGLDGLSMIELTRSVCRHSRVIFISAYEDFSFAQRALVLRASEYLLKPFEPEALLSSVRRIIAEMKPDGGDARDGLAERMLQYVRTHISRQMSLQELSERFYLSPSYISSLIKKSTGMNFIDWQTRARIDLAKQMLREGGYRIEEISGAVGYRNYVTFYKVFTKKVGSSPSEYRNEPEHADDKNDAEQ